jgi:YebC/PmpR family DNA-binding regulatory protein
MAGHSQFKNIMHRKGKEDAKRAKAFARLSREIIVAAKGGTDMGFNPRLRAAVLAARAENMPKDKIENAIKRGSGQSDADNFDEIRYEGYGPGGVAILVETMTNNRNRTAADIRSIFTKNGGNMGESGSVGFMFARKGIITYPLSAGSEDAVMEAAIEAGADNCETHEDGHTVDCPMEMFNDVRDALITKLGDPSSAKLQWVPTITSKVDAANAPTLMKLLDTLDDNDDVQDVTANAEFDDETMAKLSA